MHERRGLQRLTDLCSGPGKLTQALGIELGDNATSLVDGPVAVLAREGRAAGGRDRARIGITKAADLAVALLRARQPARVAAADRLALQLSGSGVGAGAAGRRRAGRRGLAAASSAAPVRRRGRRRLGVGRRRRGLAGAPVPVWRRLRRHVALGRGRGAVGSGVGRRRLGRPGGGRRLLGRQALAAALGRSARLDDPRSRSMTKSRQISAGKVPPSTGPPWKSVCIGLSLSG